MNRGELRTELENVIQDGSFSEATLNNYINMALKYACAQVLLPSLKRVDTVETSTTAAYVALTGLGGGFSGVLNKVVDSDENDIYIYGNLDELMTEYPLLNEEGDIEGVALEGSTLWYQKIPDEAETLTVLYYRNPEELSADGDTPGEVPDFLHIPLLVFGSAFFVYNQIEDGIEGNKVNAKSHWWMSFDESNRESGISKFREWIGKRRRHHISSFWGY
jgi:hypothetical protein